MPLHEKYFTINNIIVTVNSDLS